MHQVVYISYTPLAFNFLYFSAQREGVSLLPLPIHLEGDML